ncbi:MAG: hypothetical protein ACKOYK_06885 [Cyanobium sp.]
MHVFGRSIALTSTEQILGQIQAFDLLGLVGIGFIILRVIQSDLIICWSVMQGPGFAAAAFHIGEAFLTAIGPILGDDKMGLRAEKIGFAPKAVVDVGKQSFCHPFSHTLSEGGSLLLLFPAPAANTLG